MMLISSGPKVVKRHRRRHYGPDHVVGHSTTLHKPFLKHCILNSQAMETIWRPFPNPFRRNVQCPNHRPLWVLVGTHSATGPSSLSDEETQPILAAVTMYCVYWILLPPRLGWLLVSGLIWRIICKILNVSSFDYSHYSTAKVVCALLILKPTQILYIIMDVGSPLTTKGYRYHDPVASGVWTKLF